MDGRVRVAVARRPGSTAGRRRPRAAGDLGLHARPRRRVRQRPGARPSRLPGRRRGAARGALRVLDRHQPRCSAARRAARRAGSAARGGWSSARAATASSAATCCCRACSSTRRPATARPRSPPAAEAAAIGERFGDADLFALAAHDQGILLIKQGRVRRGSRPARRGDGRGHRGRAVADRQRLRLLRRDHGLPGGVRSAARPGVDRGPDALVRAAARHGQLHAAPACVHRAEIMQLHGAWPERAGGGAAGGRALRAGGERVGRRPGPLPAGRGPSPAGRVRRGRGGLPGARSRRGCEPQPGLALLRLAAGQPATPRRPRSAALLAETSEPSKRAGLLPAYVEIMLAVGDLQAARGAVRGARGDRRALGGRHDRRDGGARPGSGRAGRGRRARGAGRAARRRRRRGASSRRRTRRRARGVLVGLACAALGDDDTAALELEAAREVFERLGAAPDLARARRARPPRRAPATRMG